MTHSAIFNSVLLCYFIYMNMLDMAPKFIFGCTEEFEICNWSNNAFDIISQIVSYTKMI